MYDLNKFELLHRLHCSCAGICCDGRGEAVNNLFSLSVYQKHSAAICKQTTDLERCKGTKHTVSGAARAVDLHVHE
jgi:hypothetical protein